jgi:hypothetical protein
MLCLTTGFIRRPSAAGDPGRKAVQNHFLLSTDANGSQTLVGRGACEQDVLEDFEARDRGVPAFRKLPGFGAPEGWSYESLADPATQFNGQATGRIYSASISFRRPA